MVRALGHRGPGRFRPRELAPTGPRTSTSPSGTRGWRSSTSPSAARSRCATTPAASPSPSTARSTTSRAVRAELERRGRQFRSHSDTEVILDGYARGETTSSISCAACLRSRCGTRSVAGCLIARDRLGIKPLYFVERHGQFLFASEVRALLASGLVSPTIDSAGPRSVSGLPDDVPRRRRWS